MPVSRRDSLDDSTSCNSIGLACPLAAPHAGRDWLALDSSASSTSEPQVPHSVQRPSHLADWYAHD